MPKYVPSRSDLKRALKKKKGQALEKPARIAFGLGIRRSKFRQEREILGVVVQDGEGG